VNSLASASLLQQALQLVRPLRVESIDAADEPGRIGQSARSGGFSCD